jgi:metal-sulfur cluster biosynthetic enzyme
LASELDSRIRGLLNEVLDPCSIGRGVPAGLLDMGMLCDLDLQSRTDGRVDVLATVRITSPGCTFGLYFENQIRARLEPLVEVESVEIVWDTSFDWSDDDMSDELKLRLRRKRDAAIARARASRAVTRQSASASAG